MPATDQGHAVPSSWEKPANKAWYVFKYINPASAEDPMASFVAGFERAYRDSLSDQTDFIQLREMLQRMLVLLESLAVERDVVRSLREFEEDAP